MVRPSDAYVGWYKNNSTWIWQHDTTNFNVAGGIIATGNVTAYSDLKLKQNIVTIDSALEKVLDLRGVYYTRKDDDKHIRKIGVIAQEVKEIVPEIVITHFDHNLDGTLKDETLTVDYGNITALLIEAIKDQQKQIEELKLLVQSISRK
jgi:hypothetical protein